MHEMRAASNSHLEMAADSVRSPPEAKSIHRRPRSSRTTRPRVIPTTPTALPITPSTQRHLVTPDPPSHSTPSSSKHRSKTEPNRFQDAEDNSRPGGGKNEERFKTLKLRVGGVTLGSRTVSVQKPKVPESKDGKRKRYRLVLQDDDDDDELPLPNQTVPAQHGGSHDPPMAAEVETEAPVEEAAAAGMRKSSRVPKPKFMPDSVPEIKEETTEPFAGPEKATAAKSKSKSHSKRPAAESHLDGAMPPPEELPEVAPALTGDDLELNGNLSYDAAGDVTDDVADKVTDDLADDDVADDLDGDDVADDLEEGEGEEGNLDAFFSGNLTARQKALSLKEMDSAVEFPDGLAEKPSKMKSAEDTEAERLVKREEAARKRKIQSEKAAKESQAAVIQKILGQDSNRKRREGRIIKQRQEAEKEKDAAENETAVQSIRWVQNEKGMTVSFSEDVGYPSIFNEQIQYPPARESCVAPQCSNPYRYKHSALKLPICSLHCYRAVSSLTPS